MFNLLILLGLVLGQEAYAQRQLPVFHIKDNKIEPQPLPVVVLQKSPQISPVNADDINRKQLIIADQFGVRLNIIGIENGVVIVRVDPSPNVPMNTPQLLDYQKQLLVHLNHQFQNTERRQTDRGHIRNPHSSRSGESHSRHDSNESDERRRHLLLEPSFHQQRQFGPQTQPLDHSSTGTHNPFLPSTGQEQVNRSRNRESHNSHSREDQSRRHSNESEERRRHLLPIPPAHQQNGIRPQQIRFMHQVGPQNAFGHPSQRSGARLQHFVQ